MKEFQLKAQKKIHYTKFNYEITVMCTLVMCTNLHKYLKMQTSCCTQSYRYNTELYISHDVKTSEPHHLSTVADPGGGGHVHPPLEGSASTPTLEAYFVHSITQCGIGAYSL